MRKIVLAALGGVVLLAGGAVAGMCADGDLCEPARLSGKAGQRLAQGPMMGEHGGQMMGRSMMRGMMRGRRMGNPVRHRRVMMGGGVPAPYAAMRNPLKPTKANIEAGRRLYAENCASCHGAKGYGDGEAGKELNPPPANIAFTVRMPIATDGFLMWTISEGGEKLGTAMPAFKDVLSAKERWQIILYLRHGLGK